MYDNGYKNITNIDISSVVIEQIIMRSQERPEMKYQVADVTNMPEFETNSFDIMIDKSTIDALLCGD